MAILEPDARVKAAFPTHALTRGFGHNTQIEWGKRDDEKVRSLCESRLNASSYCHYVPKRANILLLILTPGLYYS